MTNFARTALLIGGLTFFFLVIGHLIGGPRGAMLALVIALALNFFAYWQSDKIVLSMYNAHEVDRSSAPIYYQLVQRLAANARLPMPKVYLIESDQPNAFATGRNPENAAVAATTSLLNMLEEREIAGVMAHELAHIANRDTLTMTITATLAGAIGYLVQMPFMFRQHQENGERSVGGIVHLVLMIMAPLMAMLVQMAISRTREYSADALGAEFCGDPGALASALNKIDASAHAIVNERAENNPATAHLFIINPLSGKAMDNLFSTHPKTQNRVERLLAMANRYQRSPVPSVSEHPGPWSR